MSDGCYSLNRFCCVKENLRHVRIAVVNKNPSHPKKKKDETEKMILINTTLYVCRVLHNILLTVNYYCVEVVVAFRFPLFRYVQFNILHHDRTNEQHYYF